MNNGNQLTLSPADTERFQACESVIKTGLKTFVEVGNALLEIRDARLYRQDYKSFEDYCRDRWSIKKSQTYRLIDAAKVAANLSPIGEFPTHESQVRPLTKLEPEQQREAWDLACKFNQHPTALDTEHATEVIERAITDAYNDSQKARELHAMRIPVPGKPNPPFDDRWIELSSAISRIARIDPFDAQAIAKQEFRVSVPSTRETAIFKCEQAISRIQQYVDEIRKKHSHVCT